MLWIKDCIYQPNGLMIQNLVVEDESEDYGSVGFKLSERNIKFRVAKITPTKAGQFVTFWKRMGKGPIQPYDYNDPFDQLMASVRTEHWIGKFIIPKKVLIEKGILSTDSKEGKRAMRVYPAWDKVYNAQAKRTQAWQLEWFIEFSPEGQLDISRLEYLLEQKSQL